MSVRKNTHAKVHKINILVKLFEQVIVTNSMYRFILQWADCIRSGVDIWPGGKALIIRSILEITRVLYRPAEAWLLLALQEQKGIHYNSSSYRHLLGHLPKGAHISSESHKGPVFDKEFNNLDHTSATNPISSFLGSPARDTASSGVFTILY